MFLGVVSGQTALTPHRRSCRASPSTMTSQAKRKLPGQLGAARKAHSARQGMIWGHPEAHGLAFSLQESMLPASAGAFGASEEGKGAEDCFTDIFTSPGA